MKLGTMMDYLDWRGDISFATDPLNHVDNLIFAQLAYVEFDGIVPGPDSEERMDIEEANERFWQTHTEKEVQRGKTLFHLAPMLMKKVSASRRFKGMQLSCFTNTVSAERNEQMSAITFHLRNGLTYVAFRGTDDTLTGWKEDFYLSFLEQSPGQRMAADYLSQRASRVEGELYVGGHSKGGNFAVFASAFCDEAVRERIARVYTNDGPGFFPSVIQSQGYQEILPRIVSIIPEESIFGLLLDCGYRSMVVKSNNKGLWQHDAMSWGVLGNHFVEAEKVNKSSQLVEQTVERWIARLTLEERKQFVDTMFEIIESSGKDTLSGIQGAKLTSLLDMMSSFRHMDTQERTKMRGMLQQLLRAGAEVLRQDITEDLI